MTYRTVAPVDVSKEQTPVGLVRIANLWHPCFIASEKDGWYCAVFGGEWDDHGVEIRTPAEIDVEAEDLMVRIDWGGWLTNG